MKYTKSTRDKLLSDTRYDVAIRRRWIKEVQENLPNRFACQTFISFVANSSYPLKSEQPTTQERRVNNNVTRIICSHIEVVNGLKGYG